MLTLTPQDKWKAVSHLQKCIRRGWSDRIEDVAYALWDVDNAYLRYRLSVIAVEDVGIANLARVHNLLEDKINKRWVMANGGIDGLINTMVSLSNGTKDRTACSWGSNACRESFEDRFGHWESVTPIQACDIAWDESQDHRVRAAAVFRAAGTDIFAHHEFTQVKGDWLSWLDACRERVGEPLVVETMIRAQKTQKEWHPAFLALCSYEHAHRGMADILVQPKDWGDAGSFCGASIDGHTAEGKRAISRLWRSCTPLRQGWHQLGWRGSDEEAVSLLSKMIFLLEGGAVDKRLGYSAAVEAENMQKIRWSMRASMPGKEAAAVVWQNMPFLAPLRSQQLPQYKIGPATDFT